MGVILNPQGQPAYAAGARAGVEGGAPQISDNDPYIKALQHLMYGQGAYHASDLVETNYATAVEALGCTGIRVEDPDDLADALKRAMAVGGPVVLDVVVTRDPSRMLPAADSRAVTIKKGDRIA